MIFATAKSKVDSKSKIIVITKPNIYTYTHTHTHTHISIGKNQRIQPIRENSTYQRHINTFALDNRSLLSYQDTN